jgi:hypothetical protein
VTRLASLLIGALALGACNPFAPAVEEGDALGLGDPTTIEGFFTAFQTAYELRDIALYEPLLDSSFTFVFYDFDAQVEQRYGFEQDLRTTRGLFAQSNLIQLRWNQILQQTVDRPPLRAQVVRPFNLTVSLEGGSVFRGSGNVNFLLVRSDTTAAWQLLRWRDESEL